jgi:hypothetical protein
VEKIVTLDCATGHVEHRDMTPDELAALQELRDGSKRLVQAQKDADDARDAVLATVAQKTGVPVDDLKRAFRAGRRDDTPKRADQR